MKKLDDVDVEEGVSSAFGLCSGFVVFGYIIMFSWIVTLYMTGWIRKIK